MIVHSIQAIRFSKCYIRQMQTLFSLVIIILSKELKEDSFTVNIS